MKAQAGGQRLGTCLSSKPGVGVAGETRGTMFQKLSSSRGPCCMAPLVFAACCFGRPGRGAAGRAGRAGRADLPGARRAGAGLRRLSGGRGPSGGGARLGASWWTGFHRQAPSPVSRFRGFAVEESPSLVRGWGRLKLFNSLGFRSPGGMVMGRWLACGAFSNLALVRSCSLGRPCWAFPLKEEG